MYAIAGQFFLTAFAASQSRWTWQNPLPQGNWLKGAQVIDANTALSVGTLSTVIKTTNGGGAWTVQSYTGGAIATLQGLSFTDQSFGVSVGDSGTIVRTTDGGITWNQQNSGTSSHLLATYFSDLDNGTAVGYSPAVILRTTNGGITWNQQKSGTDMVLRDVSFANTNLGLIVGGSPGIGGILLRTTDGGLNWSEVPVGTAAWLAGVQFVDENTAVAVGSQGTVLRSTDSGLSWIIQTIGALQDLESVSFSDPNVGLVLSEENLYRTTNGGATWVLVNLSSTARLTDVSLHPSGQGLIVGEFGTIYRSSNFGTNWVLSSSGAIAEIDGMTFSDGLNGACVGFQRVFRTTNGGSTWTSASLTGFLSDVAFADVLIGTIVGGSGFSGIVWRTTNGGISWTNQDISAEPLGGVDYATTSVGIMVGNHGTILRTTNAGLNWDSQPSGTIANLASIHLIDENTAVVVGGTTAPNSSIILRTSDGGTTWLSRPSPTVNFLHDVSFADAYTGLAVGDFGTIIGTTDGGITWTMQNSGTTVSLHGVEFQPGTTNAIVVGYGGFIMRTVDSGFSWDEEPSGTAITLNCVSWQPGSGFTASGLNGNIIHSSLMAIAPTVQVDVHIDSLHTFVPAVGDTFAYQMTVTNETTVLQTVDLWTKVLRPGSNPIDPLFGPETIVLPPSGMIIIDTAKLPIPYNAVEGDYSLVAFAGIYQADTLDSDTTGFTKLPQIPCDSIDQFQAKCKRGGAIQARILLLNSTEYAGEEVLMGVDGVNQLATVITNGIHSKAQIQLNGQTMGSHTVSLVSPAGCFKPISVSCVSNVAADGTESSWEESDGWAFANDVSNEGIPETTRLYDNYPDPFNPTTTIVYDLPAESRVILKIYDLLGQEVLTLVDQVESAGRHKVPFNASNLSSGTYFYGLETNGFRDVKKLLLLR